MAGAKKGLTGIITYFLIFLSGVYTINFVPYNLTLTILIYDSFERESLPCSDAFFSGPIVIGIIDYSLVWEFICSNLLSIWGDTMRV